MDWLNYQHLLYFRTVVKEGGISRAAEKLRLRPHTISAQLKLLQSSLGQALFEKSGRQLVLTQAGHRALRYCDEIFRLGDDLRSDLAGRDHGRAPFLVGVADSLPKLLAVRLLAPLHQGPQAVRLVCEEDKSERLVASLAVQELDVVLSDRPAPPTVRVRAYSHFLGECGVSFLASPKLAAQRKGSFPAKLRGAPMLLPTESSALRRALELWRETEGLEWSLRGEFEDSALLKLFAREGLGIVPVPTVAEKEACRQFGLRLVGRSEAVRERFYAITVERKVANPLLQRVMENASERVFGKA